MVRPWCWKSCRPLKTCNSPDSGESLVVDLKVDTNHSLWVKHIFLCLAENLIYKQNRWPWMHWSFALFRYVLLYCVFFFFFCDSICLWWWQVVISFWWYVWLRKALTLQFLLCCGWENKTGSANRDIWCGCLFTHRGSDKTIFFHLLALLVYLFNQYFNPTLHVLFFVPLFFPRSFQSFY